MWVIRFLSGPLAGKTYPLQPGRNTIGRSNEANLRITEDGISKLHAELYVLEDKVIFKDLNSSNGSFVNGVRVQSRKVVSADKIGINNVIFDIHKVDPQTAAAAQAAMQAARAQRVQQQQAQAPAHMAEPGMQNPSPEMGPAPEVGQDKKFRNVKEMFQYYLDDVALPGIYKLAEITEFRWVLTCFMLLLIVGVTLLSMIPMIQISKSSIEKESQRHARTIARNLAKSNEGALLQGLESAVNVQQAQKEEGVKAALVISHVDGHIIAPVDHMGSYAEQPFVHTARRENKETIVQLDDNTIGATVPVSYYNAQVGTYQVVAHAVVVYDMSSLAVNEGRTISLFVQTLTMALIFGGLIFFFMYRLIEQPIIDINKKLDVALRDGQDNITTTYQFPAIRALTENLSSLLARALYGGADNQDALTYQADKDVEAENLLRIIGCPGMAINAENHTVIAINEMFESVVDVTLSSLKEKGIEAIPDQAFQLNLSDLTDRVEQQPSLIATNELELRGVDCELSAQAISNKGKVEYIILTIQQLSEDEEEAA